MFNMDDIDPKVRVQIASQILDRAGLVASKDINVNVNVNTAIADRARQLLQERITIDATATPVPQTPALEVATGANIMEENRKNDESELAQSQSRSGI